MVELPERAIDSVIPDGCVVVHEKVTPAVALANVTIEELVPEHIDCGAGLKVITGLGFTVTVTVKGEVQLAGDVPDDAVTLYITLIGALVELINVWLIVDTPEV
jgi:hypothetical protein